MFHEWQTLQSQSDQHGACRGGRGGRSILPRIISAMAGLTVSVGAAGPAFLVASDSSDGRTYSVSETSSSCILADDDDSRTTFGLGAAAGGTKMAPAPAPPPSRAAAEQ